jgi:hypothetical protein
MADSRAAAAPTGETTSPSLSGGWKPVTLISSRSQIKQEQNGTDFLADLAAITV